MRWPVMPRASGSLLRVGAAVHRCARYAIAAAALLMLGSTPGIGGVALAKALATASMPESLSCSATMPARLRSGQAAVLTLTLLNSSRQTVYLLRRNTPLEGWLADSLVVERDGQPVPYIGAMAKRMPPSMSEYLALPAGKTYRFRAQLQGGYDVAVAGNYRVQWQGALLDMVVGARPQIGHDLSPATVRCEPVNFVRAG